MAEQKRKKNSTASKAAAKQGGSRGGKGKKSASRPIRREVGACVCLFLGVFTILCCFGALLVAVIVYALLVIVLKAITYDDCMLLPKGDKIAKILRIR